MSAAVHLFAGLDAVTDDATATVIAAGRQIVDGAFETVVGRTLPGSDHFE
ncbi:MAG TPA: hypothetical protein VN645_01165 [Steroidobacteraceae bacterium]|nr:hypothetical protein [Steroidobacteraceae bacterium]